MSLSDRRSFVVALTSLTALAACGFQPVYAPGSGAASLRNAVQVDAPSNRTTFDMVRAIEDRLGRAENARYGLAIAQTEVVNSLAIEGSSAVTRFNIVATANFTLTDRTTGTVASSGSVRTFTSFSATGSTVATAAAQKDARRRLAAGLADLIVTQLLLDVPDPA